MASVNNRLCGILIHSKLTESFGIEHFSGVKDSGKVLNLL